MDIALQLYTVRDALEKDFAGALRAVAELGYPGVEFAGYGGFEAAALRDLLAELNLKAVGSHVPLQALQEDLDAQAEFARTIGCRYIACPILPEAGGADAEAYRKAAALFNDLGRRLAGYGIQFAYHNHNFEFVRRDGKCGMEILIEETDPALVQFELDVYWVKFAGLDPVEWLKRLEGRADLVHIKDMTAGDDPTFAEIGEGVIDFQPIFAAAEAAGTKCLIVEQDRCARPSLESAALSIQNLKAWKML